MQRLLRRSARSWRRLRASRPGQRFQDWHRQQGGAAGATLKRLLALSLGAALAAAGIVLMPMPGPGLLVAVAGLAVLAGASLTAARAFDAGELWIRRAARRFVIRWRHASAWRRAAAVALVLGAVVASALGLALLVVEVVGLA